MLLCGSNPVNKTVLNWPEHSDTLLMSTFWWKWMKFGGIAVVGKNVPTHFFLMQEYNGNSFITLEYFLLCYPLVNFDQKSSQIIFSLFPQILIMK